MKYFDEDTKTEMVVSRSIDEWTQSTESVDKTVKRAITEYKAGKISLDDLSCICGYWYNELLNDNKTKYSSELMHVLEVGSDLAYLERVESRNFIHELGIVLMYGESKKVLS